MSTLSGPSEWDEAVLASMTRDQLLLFGKLHESHGNLRRENARLAAQNAEASSMVATFVRIQSENAAEIDRLKRLAFGAGMALAGVVPMRGYAADLITAQDLIKQMLEES